jgi:hypothetical protein
VPTERILYSRLVGVTEPVAPIFVRGFNQDYSAARHILATSQLQCKTVRSGRVNTVKLGSTLVFWRGPNTACMRIVAHHGAVIGNDTLAHLTTSNKLGYRFWRMPATRFSSIMIRTMTKPYYSQTVHRQLLLYHGLYHRVTRLASASTYADLRVSITSGLAYRVLVVLPLWTLLYSPRASEIWSQQAAFSLALLKYAVGISRLSLHVLIAMIALRDQPHLQPTSSTRR